MSEEGRYKVVRAEREVTPSFTLNQIGKAAFKRAEAHERGWWEDIITAQLMCALTMEAVLNHVGQKVFEDVGLTATWAVVDRARPRKKLDAILEHLRLQVDMSQPPFQHFSDMFKLRNDLAHARSVRLVTSDIPDDAVDEQEWLIDSRVPGLRADWENMCNLETAARWRDSVYKMSAVLCSAADCMDPVLIGDNASWSGTHQQSGKA